MFVICAGMYRAGSTWQYQVVNHLLERSGRCERLGFIEGAGFAELAPLSTDSAWQVFKTHAGHPDFATLLAEGKAIGVYCYRDLRDTVFSMAHKAGLPFADIAPWAVAACKESFAFWTAQPGMLAQRYDLITGEPERAVRELAEFLDVKLASGEAEAIARMYGLEANRKRADAVKQQLEAQGVDLHDPGNALLNDPHSQVHWNHIRERKSSDWRDEASPAECFFLVRTCGKWLVEQQFESDPLWAAVEEADPSPKLTAAQHAANLWGAVEEKDQLLPRITGGVDAVRETT